MAFGIFSDLPMNSQFIQDFHNPFPSICCWKASKHPQIFRASKAKNGRNINITICIFGSATKGAVLHKVHVWTNNEHVFANYNETS